MKLKTDDQGHAILADGKPVYVKDDGTEVPVDVPELFAKIPALNDEARKHRLAAKEANEKLAAFGELDPEEARKAVETVQNLNDKKLVDAGDVAKLKESMAEQWTKKEAEWQKAIETRDRQLYQLQVGNAFAHSPYVTEKLAIPPDMAERFFSDRFGVEDGKVVAKDAAGNPIMSPTRIGEPADFEEAIEALVNSYPHRDAILKGGTPGSGSTGGGGGGSTAKPLRAMTPQEKAAKAAELGPARWTAFVNSQQQADLARAHPQHGGRE